MTKYRNLSEINFSSTVDLSSTSSSTSLSNTAVDVSKILPDNTSQNSQTEVVIQEIDTSNAIIEPESVVNIETNSGVKRVCFFCGKDRKQSKGKQQTLHSSNDANIYKKIAEWMTN